MVMETRKFDLEERTQDFSKEIILLCYSIKNTSVSGPLIRQLVRSGTSIGANYCEATETGSKKDFRHKLLIAKKEAKETIYWLKLLKLAEGTDNGKIDLLISEAKELLLIFAASIRKVS